MAADLDITLNGTPTAVYLGENTTEALRQAQLAEASATAAAVSEAVALAAAGPNYASTAAGLAATAEGETFAVDNGNDTITVYRHDAGPTATTLRTFPRDILALLASTASGKGAALVVLEDGTDLQAAVTAKVATADLASTASGKGAGLVGFKQVGAGAVERTVQAKLEELISVLDFIPVAYHAAIRDGSTTQDVTSYIQAAIDAVYTLGGGTIYFPEGIYLVSALSKTFAGSVSITFRGDGKFASTLKKTGATTTPILTLTATGVLDIYGGFEDLGLQGASKSAPGLRLIDVSRIKMDSIFVRDCDVGLDFQGGLIIQANDCSVNSNNTGLKTRASASAVYCNLLSFTGGEIRGNTSWGCDLGEGMGNHFRSVDIEQNGTALNTATGAVIIRDTVDNESGYAVFSFGSCWFEQNDGKTLVAEDASLTNLSLDSCFFINNEAGLDVNVGTIRNFTAINCVSPSTGSTWTIAAALSQIVGCHIDIVSDTSGSRFHMNVVNSGLTLQEGTALGTVGWSRTTLGFFGVTKVARAAALTQLYSTAERTLSAYTPDNESAAYTGAADGEAKLADLNALRTAYENLRAFVEDLAQHHNAVVDDLQAYGLAQ